jgi:hypothetical protein
MKIPMLQKRFSRQHGAIMIAAMVLLIVGAMFVTLWIRVLATRGIQVNAMEDGIRRRISLENSRQLSMQSAHASGFLPNSTLAANTSFGLSGTDYQNQTVSYGGLSTASAWSNMNIYTSSTLPDTLDKFYPYNYCSLRQGHPFYTFRSFKKSSAATHMDEYDSNLFRTFPPVLAKDLIVYYKKPSAVFYANNQNPVNIGVLATGALAGLNLNWIVDGRVTVRDPSSFYAASTTTAQQFPFYCRSLYIQQHDSENSRLLSGTTITDFSNPTAPGNLVSQLTPSNLPAVPSSVGLNSTNIEDRFKGDLNVVRNNANTTNSLWHFIDRERAANNSTTMDISAFSVTGTSADPVWTTKYTASTNPDPNPLYAPFNFYSVGSQLPKGASMGEIKTVYVNLANANASNIRITDSTVNQIVLIGQSNNTDFTAAGLLRPLMIVVEKTTVQTLYVTMVHNNNRRLVLGIKYPIQTNTGSFMHWTGSSFGPVAAGMSDRHDWRMVLINEGELIRMELPANKGVRWIGGIMSNWIIARGTVQNGNLFHRLLTFVSDSTVPIVLPTPAPYQFANFIPRDGWVESFFVPLQPN